MKFKSRCFSISLQIGPYLFRTSRKNVPKKSLNSPFSVPKKYLLGTYIFRDPVGNTAYPTIDINLLYVSAYYSSYYSVF